MAQPSPHSYPRYTIGHSAGAGALAVIVDERIRDEYVCPYKGVLAAEVGPPAVDDDA